MYREADQGLERTERIVSFHVPEASRLTAADHPLMGTDATAGNNGAFDLESREPGWRLVLICSDGTEVPDVLEWQWEHVSVRAYRGSQSRIPTWREMCFVKGLCWDDEDVVVQYHPRKSEYVNCHPHVLHLWRPKDQTIPTPPAILIGVLRPR
jgi:hypothetical protein